MILTDTGLLVALLDADDPYHTPVSRQLTVYHLARC